VFFALNHLLHFYRGQIPFDAYLRLLREVPALEARNGTMIPSHNLLVERIAAQSSPPHALGITAGSDAHTLRRIGLTWTEAPGRTRDEFLASLRQGLGRPGGLHGGAGAVFGDAYGVIARYMATLVGFGTADVHGWRRAGCLTFSALSLPGEFLPIAIAIRGKRREAREARRARAALDRWNEVEAPTPAVSRA
jgi:hypothetical protein